MLQENSSLFVILFGLLIGVIDTKSSPIDPTSDNAKVRGDVILQPGDNYNISCEGNRPLKWIYPSVPKDYINSTTISQLQAEHKDKKESKYASTLLISNITFPYVGYYFCVEENGKKDLTKFYLYVDDDQHLSVKERELERVFSTRFEDVILPCRPTSPTVNVTLKTGESELDFDTLYDEAVSYRYDPHVGIMTNATQHETSLLFTCVFSSGITRSSLWINLTIENTKPPPNNSMADITSKPEDVILQPGDNYTILCEGNRPLKWNYPNVLNGYVNYTTISQLDTEIQDKKESKYSSYLLISNMTFPYVGYYYCMEENGKENLTKLYLYVDDHQHLSVLGQKFERVFTTKSKEVILPCRPTSPKVNVILKRITKIEFDTLDDEEVYYHYDPHVGIITNATQQETSLMFTCVFDNGIIRTRNRINLRIEKTVNTIRQPDIRKLSNISIIGGTLKLKCLVSANVSVKLEWTTPSQDKSRVSLSLLDDATPLKSINLTIKNITLDDKGLYTCRASDHQGHSSEITIQENVYGTNEHFLYLKNEKNSTKTIEAGTKEFQWKVMIDAYPPPTITWEYSKDKTVSVPEVITRIIDETHNETILKISGVSLSHYGNYSLTARNSENDTEKLILFLNVTDEPHIEMNAQGEFKMLNKLEMVDCTATANPKPEIFWKFKPCLDNTCVYQNISNFTISQKGLEISSRVKKMFNKSGLIKCSAKNSRGEVAKEKSIYVSDIRNGFGIIEVDDNTKEVTVAKSDELTLSCGAHIRNFNQTIEWSVSSTIIITNDKYKIQKLRTEFSDRTVLTINRMVENVEGYYTCILYKLKNGGTERMKEAHVKVVMRPPLAPRLIKTNMNATAELNVGEKLELICQFDGLPKPEITWYKNNEVFVTSDSQVIRDKNGYKNASLKFYYTKQQDEGTYKCEGRNREGTVSKEIVVSFESKSGSYLYIVIIVILLCIVVAAIFTIYVKDSRKRKLEQVLREAGLAYFEKGQVENLNPDLGIDDQAELLPYDKKWEIPIENLKLGKQLGAGAFGVVIKGEAKGIFPEEPVTTVAVKMVKRNAEHSCIRALASELKIMAHLGKHLNVLNLLGACTKNVAKKELLVIVEYCKYGNIHNYLYRNRNDFINQVDPETGCLDFTAGFEKLERSYSVTSTKSSYQMKYAANFYLRKDSNRPLLPNTDTNNDSSSCSTAAQNDSAKVNMSPQIEEGEEYVVLTSGGSGVHPAWRTNYKSDYKGTVGPICTEDLIIWAFQVARGMEYLASRKVLHGDLAARNILLTDDNVVKICDFGLAKSMYHNENYKKKSNCPLPIKWMAIESIRDRVFCTQSDVWAFGVVLWELFSLAKTPYPGMEADERLYSKLVEGYRMESPEFATQEIYQIMLDCWSQKPMDRPSFTKLCETIGSILEDGVKKHYVELNNPFLEINLKRFQDVEEDYLAMVSSPNFENLSSPNHYINEGVQSPDYMSMNSKGVFSPKPQDGNIFNFDKSKQETSTSSPQEAPVELTPMLGDYEKPYEAPSENCTNPTEEIEHTFVESSTCSVSNPSYSIPPSISVPITESEVSKIPLRHEKDGENGNPFAKKRLSSEEHYVNSCARNWDVVCP